MLLEKRQFVNCFIKLLAANNKQHFVSRRETWPLLIAARSAATDSEASQEPALVRVGQNASVYFCRTDSGHVQAVHTHIYIYRERDIDTYIYIYTLYMCAYCKYTCLYLFCCLSPSSSAVSLPGPMNNFCAVLCRGTSGAA